MQTIYKTNLPAGVTADQVTADLTQFIGEHATVAVRPLSRSGQGGKLGQIDPTLFEVIIHLLDTEAAAAAVQTILSGVGGYLLGKTGKKPTVETKQSEED